MVCLLLHHLEVNMEDHLHHLADILHHLHMKLLKDHQLNINLVHNNNITSSNNSNQDPSSNQVYKILQIRNNSSTNIRHDHKVQQIHRQQYYQQPGSQNSAGSQQQYYQQQSGSQQQYYQQQPGS